MKAISVSVPPIQGSPLRENKEVDSRWNQLKLSNAFTPRSSFAFCANKEIGYLHGGSSPDEGILEDMYTVNFLDIEDRRWHKVPLQGQHPGKLRNHTLTSFKHLVLCVGGQKNMLEDNSSIYKFNILSRKWSLVEVKPGKTLAQEQNQTQSIKKFLARDSHSQFLCDQKLYIFGGYYPETGEYLNQMISLDMSNLEKDNLVELDLISNISGETPPPRSNMAYCANGSLFYIFGGSNEKCLSDLWRFDAKTNIWTNLTLKEQLEHHGQNKVLKSLDKQHFWPEERKNAVLVLHQKSQNLILFGGMKEVTKQQNDVSVYLTVKNKWVKVHSTTNNLYDPSPTIKRQYQDSPTIIETKRKKTLQRSRQKKSQFSLSIKAANCQDGVKKLRQPHLQHNLKVSKDSRLATKSDFKKKAYKTQMSIGDLKRNPEKSVNNLSIAEGGNDHVFKHSMVQEQKYRDFLNRKKKLLAQVSVGPPEKSKRPLSPLSECLNHTIMEIGIQKQWQCSQKSGIHELPKVLFDNEKNIVIGKKPCARDGHAAFGYQQSMFIIGGDRHMVSFNDTYIFRMDKAISSINYYDKE